MGKAVKKTNKKAVKKAPAKEKPLKLDMSFEEAIRRSIQTRVKKKEQK
jgi:hypothetical protein